MKFYYQETLTIASGLSGFITATLFILGFIAPHVKHLPLTLFYLTFLSLIVTCVIIFSLIMITRP